MSNCPARAGFTGTTRSEKFPAWDHPRSRGVYASSSRFCSTVTGSSPLARGLLSAVYSSSGRKGIIPARAGFTPHAGQCVMPIWDHPRSRGVYAGLLRSASRIAGSSPLARGLPLCSTRTFCSFRIIPARAGFTSTGDWSAKDNDGSSPLARGLRDGMGPAYSFRGIIPARAGFT